MRAFTVTESGVQKGILVSPPAGRLIHDAYVRVGIAKCVPQGIAVHPSVAKMGESFERASVIRTMLEGELRIVPELPTLSDNALVLVRISRCSFRHVDWQFGVSKDKHPDPHSSILLHGYEFNPPASPCQYRLLIMKPGAILCIRQAGNPKGYTSDICIMWYEDQISFNRIDDKPPAQIDLPRIS